MWHWGRRGGAGKSPFTLAHEAEQARVETAAKAWDDAADSWWATSCQLNNLRHNCDGSGFAFVSAMACEAESKASECRAHATELRLRG